MTIGILGGGQLGRMLALAGHPLGLSFRVVDPAADACAGQVAPCDRAALDDAASIETTLGQCDAVTYESENIPAATVRQLQRHATVYPPLAALEIMQDRLREKQLFARHGIATPRFAAVDSRGQLDGAVRDIGLPAVLKTRRMGYDGKGQCVLKEPGDLETAWQQLGGQALILEQFIHWQRELSLIAVRGREGATAFYPLVENHHRNGILRLTLAPAPNCTAEFQQRAEQYLQTILDELNYVGVLTIELFQRDDELLANECAPRVHNSGHWTIEGAETSQFENHLRAIAGLPLGSTAPRGHAAMVNFIGGIPPSQQVLAIPGLHLHRYGKQFLPGRKVGHATVTHTDARVVQQRAEQLQTLIDNSEIC